jgi:hypothetical protein
VLLVLLARFAPFGVVGGVKILRSKVVLVVPRPPTAAQATTPAAGAPTTVHDEAAVRDVLVPGSDSPASTA